MRALSGLPEISGQTQALLEVVFAQTADACALCDAQLRVVAFNPAFGRLSGLRRSALPRGLAEVLPQLTAGLLAALRHAAEQGETLSALPSGLPAAPLASVYPLAGEGGPHLALLLRAAAPGGTSASRRTGELRTRRLQALTSALSQAVSVEDVRRVVLEQAVQATGAYGGTLLTMLPDGLFALIGSVGYPGGLNPRWRTFPARSEYLVVQAVRRQQPVFATRHELSPAFLALLQPNTRAVAALPLQLGRSALGLTLSFAREADIADPARPFILTVAEQCAQALQRADLYDAERQARQRATFLAEAGRLLAQSLDVEETLRRVTALATEQVADWCAVYLPQSSGELAVAAAHHQDAARVEVLKRYLKQFPADPHTPYSSAWVLRTGEAVYLPVLPPGTLEALSVEQRRLVGALGLHSLILVPLQVRGKTTGVLGLATSGPERTFGPADLELAHELAQRAAFALDNARLYQTSSLHLDRYRSLIDASRQIVWTANAEGEHVEEQPGWTRLTGQTPEEYAGDGWTRRIHPDDLPAALSAWRQAVQTRSVYEVEQRVQVLDGSYRHFHVRAVPILDADGRLREWTGVNTDITERVLAERQLREREGRYRALVEHAAIGILRTGPDRRLLEANGAAERIFGYSREELTRLTLDDLADAEGPGSAALPLGARPQERRYRRKDGQLVWANVTVSTVRDEQGQALYGVTLVEDITARKKAEREQMRLARVVEASQDFIAFADLDNELVYLNPAGKQLVGLEGAVPPGLSMVAFTHPDDAVLLRDVAWPQVTHSGHWTGEMRFVHLRTGEIIHVHRSIFALTDSATQERLGYATVSRNITEQKRRDAERLAWQATLEQQVARRTAELQELNAELDAFSYSISHDLRAPIRHILGFTALLQRTLKAGNDTRAAQHLNVIEQSASRMNVMVDALLELARRGREPLHLGAVDLDQVVRDVQLDLAPDLLGRQVEWRVGPLPQVRGDAVLLRLALFNLLSNALKYSLRQPLASVEVYAEAREREWVIHVRDNGVGFDPKYAGKLFGVFQRLHTQEDFEGNGVGLANVQRIVARHGGRIWAVGEVGHGATFSFTLPRGEEA
ncbi:hypothetical protein DKM44_14200 [Deinococcus irradiatisoli]|uniref:histidine kinase n=1 Tax=Deinococcus irradiatisoli TaxID=2202254 RepID=A0A2Z3JSK7_9DEIO|nr:PAS domain S-box protein [Deinococcus irradiatisoli]AWN24238.1 hypothetical protein DKM44_14200 [Deinococcus irradiatisoli]